MSQESNPHLTYRPDIDGLRAVAILAVVLYHAFPSKVHGGFVGVDIFFVISGYLISSIIFKGLESGKFSFLNFYAHRVKRIFPALILVLLTAFAIGWFVLLPYEFKQLGKHMAAGAGFVQNIVLWKEAGYFDNASELKPLMHLWSLAVEEQFYLIFPALMWIVWRLGLNALIVVLVIVFFSFKQNIHDTQYDIVKAYFLPQTRFWELLAGSILSYLQLFKCDGLIAKLRHSVFYTKLFGKPSVLEERQYVLNNFLAMAGFALALAAIFGISKDKAFPGWWALAPVLSSVFIILAGPEAWVNRKILANKVMLFVGMISYPLYLWHWLLLSFSHILRSGMVSREIRIAAVALSMVLAWLTYKFIERPIRFGLKRLPKTQILFFIIIAIVVAGLLVVKFDGVVSRFPVQIRGELRTPDFNWSKYVRDGRCHLQDANLIEHDALCVEKRRPLIALWGDSHASSFYPGLKKLQEKNGFGIVQLTEAGCPPINNVHSFNPLSRKNCRFVNDSALNILKRNIPDVLIMDSVYKSASEFLWGEDRIVENMSLTLDDVKKSLPKTRIIIVGPVPQWNISPQHEFFKYLRIKGLSSGVPPVRMPAMKMSSLDKKLNELSIAKDVRYISAINVLCDDVGCINRVGDQAEDFVATDYGHFSKNGAEFFADKIKDKLLVDLRPVK